MSVEGGNLQLPHETPFRANPQRLLEGVEVQGVNRVEETRVQSCGVKLAPEAAIGGLGLRPHECGTHKALWWARTPVSSRFKNQQYTTTMWWAMQRAVWACPLFLHRLITVSKHLPPQLGAFGWLPRSDACSDQLAAQTC